MLPVSPPPSLSDRIAAAVLPRRAKRAPMIASGEVTESAPTTQVGQRLTEASNKTEWVLYHGSKSGPFDQFEPGKAAKGDQFWNPLGSGMYATDSADFAANFGGQVHKVVIPPGHQYKRINQQEWATSVGWGLVMRTLKAAFKQCGESFDAWQNGTLPPPVDVTKMSREQQVERLVSFNASHMPEAQIRQRCADADADTVKRWVKHTFELGRTPTRDEAKSRKVQEFRRELYEELRKQSPYESLYETSHLVSMSFGQEIGEAFFDLLPRMADKLFAKYDFIVFSETNDVIGHGRGGNSAIEVVIFNKSLQRAQADDSRHKALGGPSKRRRKPGLASEHALGMASPAALAMAAEGRLPAGGRANRLDEQPTVAPIIDNPNPSLGRCTTVTCNSMLAHFNRAQIGAAEMPRTARDCINVLSKRGLGYRPETFDPPVTVKTFADRHARGTWFIGTQNHAMSLIDGELFDTARQGLDGRVVQLAAEIAPQGTLGPAF